MAGENKTRFDYCKAFRDILAAVVRLDIMDPMEIMLFGVNDLTEAEIFEEIVTAAFAQRHGSEGHEKVVPLIDLYRIGRFGEVEELAARVVR